MHIIWRMHSRILILYFCILYLNVNSINNISNFMCHLWTVSLPPEIGLHPPAVSLVKNWWYMTITAGLKYNLPHAVLNINCSVVHTNTGNDTIQASQDEIAQCWSWLLGCLALSVPVLRSVAISCRIAMTELVQTRIQSASASSSSSSSSLLTAESNIQYKLVKNVDRID